MKIINFLLLSVYLIFLLFQLWKISNISQFFKNIFFKSIILPIFRKIIFNFNTSVRILIKKYRSKIRKCCKTKETQFCKQDRTPLFLDRSREVNKRIFRHVSQSTCYKRVACSLSRHTHCSSFKVQAPYLFSILHAT